MSVVGLNYIDYVPSSNTAHFNIRLKPYEQRTKPSENVVAIISALRPQLAAIEGAVAFPYNRTPVHGLGTAGGFQYVLEAQRGQSAADLAAVTRALVIAANQQPELAGVFTTYAADTPQIYLDIDRNKAQVLGVKVSDVFTSLQATLGSIYINDFNLFGRTWQVNIQSDARFRGAIDDIYRVYVRGTSGAMVPIRALAEARLVQGPQTVVRYNGFPAAMINGTARHGFSSGEAIAAMERISATTLPPGYGFEWTGTAYQEKLGRRSDRHRARARRAVRLSLPRGAVRELERAAARPAVGQRRRAGRDRGRGAVRPRLRHLCADRPGRAGGARRQERHPDRGILGRATTPGKVDPGSRRSRAPGCASGPWR